ncbi:MAG: serine/threonine protein kinase [Actinomycetia bacterium]|nr:serine/threonine protein kinase [Actinomycetes bacterium]
MSDLRVGRRFGPYRIEAVLGKGGVSIVYEALNSDDELIALKLLTPFAEGRAEIRAAIEKEFRVMQRFDHPGIVRARRGGTIADIHYIEMDRVAGGTVADRLGPEVSLGVPQTVAVGIATAEALQHVHDHRVVHRDVKPSNILLTDDLDNGGVPVLFDFGLALDLDAPDAIPGRIYGSPLFISPEQALSGPPVDGRADLYSLGVTLFRLATGKAPFYGERLDLLHHHAETIAPQASSIRPVGDGLEAVLERAMAKNPDDRWQSGTELAQALRAIPADELEARAGPIPRRGLLRRRR